MPKEKLAEKDVWRNYTLEERTRKYSEFDLVAPTNDHRASRIPRVQLLQMADNQEPFIKVLDIGCHDGGITRWLVDTNHCQRLVAFDVCEPAIVSARKTILNHRHHEKANYLVASWEQFFQDNTEKFDVICFFELLEHFRREEGKTVLKHCWDALTVGGRLFLSTPEPEGCFGYQGHGPYHIELYTREETKDLLQKIVGPVCKPDYIETPDREIIHFITRKGPNDMYQFQTDNCRTGNQPILNAACKEDPAQLGEKFNAINLDLLTYDVHTKTDLTKLPNFIQGNILHLPYKDNHFGTVVLGELIEHCTLATAIQAVSECARVCQPSPTGKIVLTFPLDPRPAEEQHAPKHLEVWHPGITSWHQTVWTNPLLEELFSKSGVTETYRIPIPYYSLQIPAPQGWGLILTKLP